MHLEKLGAAFTVPLSKCLRYEMILNDLVQRAGVKPSRLNWALLSQSRLDKLNGSFLFSRQSNVADSVSLAGSERPKAGIGQMSMSQ